jgi:hypothetical protein
VISAEYHPAKPPCIFNINLNITDKSLNEDDVNAIKQEIQFVFSAAGQRVIFDDPAAARNTKRGTYHLTIAERFSPDFEEFITTIRAVTGDVIVGWTADVRPGVKGSWKCIYVLG